VLINSLRHGWNTIYFSNTENAHRVCFQLRILILDVNEWMHKERNEWTNQGLILHYTSFMFVVWLAVGDIQRIKFHSMLGKLPSFLFFFYLQQSGIGFHFSSPLWSVFKCHMFPVVSSYMCLRLWLPMLCYPHKSVISVLTYFFPMTPYFSVIKTVSKLLLIH